VVVGWRRQRKPEEWDRKGGWVWQPLPTEEKGKKNAAPNKKGRKNGSMEKNIRKSKKKG